MAKTKSRSGKEALTPLLPATASAMRAAKDRDAAALKAALALPEASGQDFSPALFEAAFHDALNASGSSFPRAIAPAKIRARFESRRS